jgi:ADP-heptose:LPS heptosyltransferase
MRELLKVGQPITQSYASTLSLGDQLPDQPTEIFSPEARNGNRGFGRSLRRLWIAITHLHRPLPLMPAKDQVKRVVVIHPGPLRELVFLEPALRALRIRFSKAERILYSTTEAVSLFAGSGWGEIRSLDLLANETKHTTEDSIVIDLTMQAEYELAKQLKRKRFSHRVGLNLGGRGSFFNIPAQPPLTTEHMVDFYLQVVEMIGTDPIGLIPSLPHGFDRVERGRRFWHERELAQPIVLLPDWDGQGLAWPADVFIDIGRNLSDQTLVVVADSNDKASARQVSKALDCPLLEDLELNSKMDVLATAALIVGNDGGLIHMANAMNRPTVTLTVNPHPWRTWPRSQVNHAVFRGQENGTAHVRFDRIPVSDIAATVLGLKEAL